MFELEGPMMKRKSMCRRYFDTQSGWL